jgi:hypothetical protein
VTAGQASVTLLLAALPPLLKVMALAMFASDLSSLGLSGESLIRIKSYGVLRGSDIHSIRAPDWTGAATPDPVTY